MGYSTDKPPMPQPSTRTPWLIAGGGLALLIGFVMMLSSYSSSPLVFNTGVVLTVSGVATIVIAAVVRDKKRALRRSKDHR